MGRRSLGRLTAVTDNMLALLESVSHSLDARGESGQRLDVKLRAAGRRPASSGAPLAAHPIMPVQVARRRANSRRRSRLGRRKKRRRTVNFNAELAGASLRLLTRFIALLFFPCDSTSVAFPYDFALKRVIRDPSQG